MENPLTARRRCGQAPRRARRRESARLPRGRGTVMTGRPAPGAAVLAGEHEGGADVRDRIGGVAVMGEATGEADAAGDAIAFAAAGDLRAGTGRAQIVDAQVERRLPPG